MTKRVPISPLLRKDVYLCYGSQCAKCRETKHLHVHHIDGDKSNTVLWNLVLLCRVHHVEAHGGYSEMGKKGAQVRIDRYIAKRAKLIEELGKIDAIFAKFIENRKKGRRGLLVTNTQIETLLKGYHHHD